MPRLIFFLPCEKAIISQEDNTISLINVIQGINVPKPSIEDAGAAVSWFAVSAWQMIPGDANKTYEHRTNLRLPNGKETGESILRFDFSKTPHHRNIVRINGFPVGQAGIYTLNLFIRELGAEQWTQVADYQITVNHIVKGALKNEK
jgi:hypothetical protein